MHKSKIYTAFLVLSELFMSSNCVQCMEHESLHQYASSKIEKVNSSTSFVLSSTMASITKNNLIQKIASIFYEIQGNEIQELHENAENGCLVSLCNLGVYYATGEGVQKDPSRAFTYFNLAAEQLHLESIINLAHCYANGFGVERSYSQALKYYEKAALHGDIDALFNAGKLYETGLGTKRDVNKALQYFFQAASLGDTQSCDIVQRYSPKKNRVLNDKK